MVYVCEMKQIKFIVGVLLPLLTGSFIYILFRVETLKMFSWFIKLGIQEEIELLRITFSFIRLPYWILFVLPDGLWLFSFISFQLLVWNGIINRENVFWFLIFPFIAISSEIGQFFELISGTFDFLDLLMYVLAATLSCIIYKKSIIINLSKI